MHQVGNAISKRVGSGPTRLLRPTILHYRVKPCNKQPMQSRARYIAIYVCRVSPGVCSNAVEPTCAAAAGELPALPLLLHGCTLHRESVHAHDLCCTPPHLLEVGCNFESSETLEAAFHWPTESATYSLCTVCIAEFMLYVISQNLIWNM